MKFNDAVLLICDDEAISSCVREKLILEGGYSVTFESTSVGGLSAMKQGTHDAVILAMGMSDMDTVEMIGGLKKIDPDAVVILLTGTQERDLSLKALKLGIYSLVAKPFNLEKLLFLVRKGVELRALMIANRRLVNGLQEQNISLQKQNSLLARRIEESSRNLSRLYEDLRATYMRTIKVLAQAIDARDHYTHSHSQNVSRIAALIAEEMNLSIKDIESIREACELHDLGKIGIGDTILTKPTSLTKEERTHLRKQKKLSPAEALGEYSLLSFPAKLPGF